MRSTLFLRSVLLSLPLLASACGNLCDHVASVERQLNDKGVVCFGEDIWPSFNTGVCHLGLDQCSQADQRRISDTYDCLAQVPQCSPSNPDFYSNAVKACLDAGLGNVAPACLNTFGY